MCEAVPLWDLGVVETGPSPQFPGGSDNWPEEDVLRHERPPLTLARPVPVVVLPPAADRIHGLHFLRRSVWRNVAFCRIVSAWTTSLLKVAGPDKTCKASRVGML
jgi:hypothetical protein